MSRKHFKRENVVHINGQHSDNDNYDGHSSPSSSTPAREDTSEPLGTSEVSDFEEEVLSDATTDATPYSTSSGTPSVVGDVKNEITDNEDMYQMITTANDSDSCELKCGQSIRFLFTCVFNSFDEWLHLIWFQSSTTLAFALFRRWLSTEINFKNRFSRIGI